MVKQKLQNILIWFVKLIVFCFAWWYIYYKFQGVSTDFTFLLSDARFSYVCLLGLLLLMILNWFVEAYKWQFLVKKIQPITYIKSLAGVLIGLPLALITPNRVGEIGGRAMIVSKNRKKIMFVTFIGSMLQLLTTLVFGVLGFLLYSFVLPQEHTIHVASVLSISILVALLMSYFIFREKRWVRTLFLKIVGRINYSKIGRVSRLFSLKHISYTFFLSALRYIIFGTQFGLIIYMFLPELSFVQIFVGITLTYFFTTIIPTSILGEIGIRGSVAMFVFGFFTQQEFIVFQASLLLWAINIVIPTLIGSVILLQVKMKK